MRRQLKRKSRPRARSICICQTGSAVARRVATADVEALLVRIDSLTRPSGD